MEEFVSLVGKQFGNLTIIDVLKDCGKSYCLCQCVCGAVKKILKYSVVNEKTKSCGCLVKVVRKTGDSRRSHGGSYTKIYIAYHHMKQRCMNKNNRDYKHYGERGIKVCDRWLESFDEFKADMNESYMEHVKKYGESNTTLDRIDINGNYEKDNCRWATWKEQGGNRRNNKKFIAISPDGKEYISNNQNEFARQFNLQQQHIGKCLLKKLRKHKDWKFKYI